MIVVFFFILLGVGFRLPFVLVLLGMEGASLSGLWSCERGRILVPVLVPKFCSFDLPVNEHKKELSRILDALGFSFISSLLITLPLSCPTTSVSLSLQFSFCIYMCYSRGFRFCFSFLFLKFLSTHSLYAPKIFFSSVTSFFIVSLFPFALSPVAHLSY